MLHISLFSGIGGFDLASQWMGWKNIVSCEINDFGNKVLQHYWPQAYHHKDIHTLTYETINAELTSRYGSGWRDDDIIITGGFPCQPFSMAGKRKGTDDERHLWPQMLRVIREVQPRWIVGENVPGIVNWSGGLVFEQVQADLEAEGYEVQAYILPACGVNAPHRRDRVWIVAHHTDARIERMRGWKNKIHGHRTTPDTRLQRPEIGRIEPMGIEQLCQERPTPDTDSNIRCKRRMHTPGHEQAERHAGARNTRFARPAWQNFPTQSPVCGRNDGLSSKLAGITVSKHRNESIKAYGNAIVPQVVYKIFKAIEKFEQS